MAKMQEKVYDFYSDSVWDDADIDHLFKAHDKYFQEAMDTNEAMENGVVIGKIFRIGVADGYAYYEISKVYKTKVHLKWRKDLCLDGYSDHHFCGGGSFSRSDVERYISFEEGMKKIFSKKK